MVDAEKTKLDDSAELKLDDETLFRIKNFYSVDTLSDDIIEFVTSKYEKNLPQWMQWMLQFLLYME